MSVAIVDMAVSRLNSQIVLMDEGWLTDMNLSLSKLSAETEPEDPVVAAAKRNSALCHALGMGEASADKPFAFANGVAVIPVHGMLINRFGGYYGYVTGYSYIRRMATMATHDDDVKIVVYDHHSGGGEASGAMELAAEIRELSKIKKSVALVDSSSLSASFALAVGASSITVIPSGTVGSIGAFRVHMDMSEAYAKAGIKIDVVKSGDKKAEGFPFKKLSDEVRADWQDAVNEIRDSFATMVAEYRGIDRQVVYDTQAGLYNAEKAKAIGLVDHVMSTASAIKLIMTSGEKPDTMAANQESTVSLQENTTMPDPTAPAIDASAAAAATAATANAAASAERERIRSICTSDAGKANPALAEHLAYGTEMSVEAAAGILAAAGTPAPAAPVAAPVAAAAAPAAAPVAAGAAFLDNMDSGRHPNVPADTVAGAADNGDSELSMADQILRDQALVIGTEAE